MGWNESPDGDKDPSGSRGNNEGPPDLDELLRKMQESFGRMFGRRPGTPSGGKSSSFPVVIVFLALVVWLVYDMSYTIDQQERGIVLRFGQYVTLLQPGLNFRLPYPIEEVILVNVGQGRTLTHTSVMLTQDENIVDVEVAVQWRIKDPLAYKFNVVNPDATLQQATESAVREVIGKSELDYVLTEGRGQIAQNQQKLIQQIMDDYKTGIEILAVKMQAAKPPEEVKSAFDDAIKAREDEQRLVNEAEAYRNDIIPKARGGAARIREEANAYKAKVVARAEGDASRFLQQLSEYEKAPDITRERLYLDAMENVLSNTNKVLLDTHGSNNLIYLPVDKLLEQRSHPQVPESQKESSPSPESQQSPATTTSETTERSSLRARGER